MIMGVYGGLFYAAFCTLAAIGELNLNMVYILFLIG